MRIIRLIINWTIILTVPIWIIFVLPLWIIGLIVSACKYKKAGIETTDYKALISGEGWIL